jgi:hypothetical protein
MALQSSGQIKLSEIATEFGGSAPHSLSEYYGAASGVPASGEIQLAADFYGTSNIVLLAAGSMTAGRVSEAKNVQGETATYIGRNPSTAFGSSSIGSMSLSTNSIGLTAFYDEFDTFAANNSQMITEVNGMSAQERADFWYIKIGNTIRSRRQGHLQSDSANQGFDTTPNSAFGWGSQNNYNFGFVNGSTYTFEMAQMKDDDVWLDTTFTVDHWFDEGVASKAGGVNYRGIELGTSHGSLGNSTATNPDSWASNTFTLSTFKMALRTGDEIAPPDYQLTFGHTGMPSSGIRGLMFTKSNGSRLFYPVGSEASSSNVRNGAGLIVSGNSAFWNFISTDNEQINLKVY